MPGFRQPTWTIWKYQLDVAADGKMSVEVPMFSELLRIGMQDGIVTAWYKVDSGQPDKRTDSYLIVPTGGTIPNDRQWHHVVTLDHGPYVWHVFRWGLA